MIPAHAAPLDHLEQVRRLAEERRNAQADYRAAIVAAVRALERAGSRDAYAQVAVAAGVSRQAVRALVNKPPDPSH